MSENLLALIFVLVAFAVSPFLIDYILKAYSDLLQTKYHNLVLTIGALLSSYFAYWVISAAPNDTLLGVLYKLSLLLIFIGLYSFLVIAVKKYLIKKYQA